MIALLLFSGSVKSLKDYKNIIGLLNLFYAILFI